MTIRRTASGASSPPPFSTRRSRRLRERQTGHTYNLADRLLGLRPYVRRGVDEVQSASELAVMLPYRAARHWWQRLTSLRSSVMNFWRMVQQAGRAGMRSGRAPGRQTALLPRGDPKTELS